MFNRHLTLCQNSSTLTSKPGPCPVGLCKKCLQHPVSHPFSQAIILRIILSPSGHSSCTSNPSVLVRWTSRTHLASGHLSPPSPLPPQSKLHLTHSSPCLCSWATTTHCPQSSHSSSPLTPFSNWRGRNTASSPGLNASSRTTTLVWKDSPATAFPCFLQSTEFMSTSGPMLAVPSAWKGSSLMTVTWLVNSGHTGFSVKGHPS